VILMPLKHIQCIDVNKIFICLAVQYAALMICKIAAIMYKHDGLKNLDLLLYAIYNVQTRNNSISCYRVLL